MVYLVTVFIMYESADTLSYWNVMLWVRMISVEIIKIKVKLGGFLRCKEELRGYIMSMLDGSFISVGFVL